MVAARAANPASDASIASDLGSLLHTHALIGDPRWRFEAVVRIVPALHRFGISLARTRTLLRDGVKAATCPTPLRGPIAQLLDDALDDGSADALASLVAVLWTRSVAGATFGAVGAALALGEHGVAREIVGHHHLAASPGRYLLPRLELLLRRGVIDGRFVGDLRTRGAESAFEPSLPLLIALVDTICEHGDVERVRDAELLLLAVPAAQRPIGIAHLARLTLQLDSVAAAIARVRAMRGRGPRTFAVLLLARSALRERRLDAARALVAVAERALLRELGELEIARALFEQGTPRDALRTLHSVRDPRLAAERDLLRAEIRLDGWDSPHGVSDQSLRIAWSAPTWTELDGPRASAAVRAALISATRSARLGGEHFDHTAELARRGCVDRAGRRLLLDLFERSGVVAADALLAMQRPHTIHVVDALRAEDVALRADRIAQQRPPHALAAGLQGHASPSADARSIERALFDEGVALSAAAPQRRRVLIATAQHCLRSALAHPATWAPEVVAVRLRTVAHLGGTRGRDSLMKALATLPMTEPFATIAIATLTILDPKVAADFVLARTVELAASAVDVDRALQLVEAHRGLPPGFAHAWVRARRAIGEQIGNERAGEWLADLVARWQLRTGHLPDVRFLTELAKRQIIPETASGLLAELDRVHHALLGDHHTKVAARVAASAELLEMVLLSQPPRIDPLMRPWTTARWRSFLEGAASKTECESDPNAVHRLARQLGELRRFGALLSGDLAALGVTSSTAFVSGADTFHVRLLDKRVDLLTYLRFADIPIRSCYRSESKFYRDGVFWTEQAVIEVWKDPLAFCFHIERRRVPCGFVFGGFAMVEGKLAIILNGLYIRPNTGEVREQIVRAIEAALCKPLGIDSIGIANVNGARGPLPGNYARRAVTLTRHRALAVGGQPIVDGYDDISDQVNTRIAVDHLWWRSQQPNIRA